MNGITIHDRENKPKPIMNTKKIGRNQLVTIKRNDAVKVLKDAKVSHKVICNILKIGNSSISRIIASNYDYEEY